jgi:hypothetical protein
MQQIRLHCDTENCMNNIKVISGLFLFFLATVSEGESIYKWVDDHGVTHYSATTPKDKRAQQLKTQPAPPVTEAAGEQPSMRDWQAKESLKNFKGNRDRQEAAETQQRAEKSKRCIDARQRLGKLQQQIRLYKTNDKGEKEYWDDDARTEETKKMEEEVANNC